MQTKTMGMSKRVYTEGQSLKRSENNNPYLAEDNCLTVISEDRNKKDLTLNIKLLAEKLSFSLHDRDEKRNKYLFGKLKELYLYKKQLDIKNGIIFCLSYVDHKEATLFLIALFPDANEETKNAIKQSLREHYKIIREKLDTDEIKNNKNSLGTYQRALEKMEKDFFKKYEVEINEE